MQQCVGVPADLPAFLPVELGGLLVEALLLVVLWRSRRALAKLQDARVERHEVQLQLARTDRLRADLIGTVSHEFRTPLTGIRGAALTLLKRGERLDVPGRAELLRAVLDQQERLSRLLENMLLAAQAVAADPGAATDVAAVATEVARLADASRPTGPPVLLAVEPDTLARIDRHALHQVLANLLDNAKQHGAPGAGPLVAGGCDPRGVWLTVSNQGSTLDSTTLQQLFEPFSQLDGTTTRQRDGLGIGLYVVRRLVEVHGGQVALRSSAGWTTVEVRLDAVDRAAVLPV